MQKEKPVYRYPKDWDGLEALKKSAYESNDSFAQLHLGTLVNSFFFLDLI